MMTEQDYSTVWEQTDKAFKYLLRKSCKTVCESVNAPFYGNEQAKLLKYYASGADERSQKHILKQYPLALIEFVAESYVTSEQKKREDMWEEYRENQLRQAQ